MFLIYSHTFNIQHVHIHFLLPYITYTSGASAVPLCLRMDVLTVRRRRREGERAGGGDCYCSSASARLQALHHSFAAWRKGWWSCSFTLAPASGCSSATYRQHFWWSTSFSKQWRFKGQLSRPVLPQLPRNAARDKQTYSELQYVCH